MLFYFKLQFNIINRKIIDFGLSPVFGYTFVILFFISLSLLLFSKTEYASYIFIGIHLLFVLRLSYKKRNTFLKSIFKDVRYYYIRILENAILCIPFCIILLYKHEFTNAFILLFASVLLALIKFNFSLKFTLPTPFKKYPFEFIIGFRKFYFLFPLAYFLAFQSIIHKNLNLGLFSMIILIYITFSFYAKLENRYYIWIYNLNPKSFLIQKVKTGLICSSIILLPIYVGL